ncbi:hypothetical protein LMG26411_03154 [Cupriavidus numazuensis]|uniref:Leucine-binding protein domain-containing protein n=1 Tax=Cupriavidus numazuensis TaxID=221992 RepID=A0ABN7PYA8_9BURK|nr:hypothetical protein LMG26411_03154 [Cupriavidus numazuensis]
MLLVCACSYAHGQQVVKIGVSSPLTGINAAHGKDMQNGVRLAIEEANAQQFKLGGKDVRFELHAVDGQSDPRIGKIAFDANGDLKNPTSTLYEVKDGRWVPVTTVGAD